MIFHRDAFTKFQFLNGQSVGDMGVFFPQTATDMVRKAALSFGTFLQKNLSLYCKKIRFWFVSFFINIARIL